MLTLLDRYWGQSSPYASLTTKNLQYLTLEQSIADLTYFAKTVKLPFDRNGSSNADKAVSSSYFGIQCICADITALGSVWWIVQRCLVRVDRVDVARHILGLPRFQRPGGGDLRLRIFPVLKSASHAHVCSGNTLLRCKRACRPTAARMSRVSSTTSTASSSPAMRPPSSS